jgi:outer membrane protein OmpA-like peptidoglycan-associated protein
MHRLSVLTALTAAIAVSLAATSPAPADAQGLGARLKKKAEEAAKKKAEERTEKRAGEATDKALDKAECAATDRACQEQKAAARVQGGEAGGDAAMALKPGEGAWVNYDFKPGDRIVYFEDLTKDEVGNFPKRMEFKSGALEIVEWQGQRFLRATENSKFSLILPEVLPERFTMEFDYAVPYGAVWVTIGGDEDNKVIEFHAQGGYVRVRNGHTGVDASGRYSNTDERDNMRRARVLGDGRYIKVYVDDKRIVNVPNADLGRRNRIHFNTGGNVDRPSLLGNFRVAESGKKIYDALAASGRVATQGIFFDTGSDRIRPESTPTLKEIGQMLTEHADLKLTIEGHTDNVGSSQANHDLSHKRAKAVAQYLVDKHGVDASRLQSTGFGDKKPTTKNDTPEGRQQNRRVELVKM